MAEKCPIHRQNDAEHFNVFQGGEMIQENVRACRVCISNTPWLEYRPVEEVVVQRKVPVTFVAASAEKYNG